MKFKEHKNSLRKNWAKVETILSCGVSCCESKLQCCKEQYCMETWNVRSMNQGKLDMVRQDMLRVKSAF